MQGILVQIQRRSLKNSKKVMEEENFDEEGLDNNLSPKYKGVTKVSDQHILNPNWKKNFYL